MFSTILLPQERDQFAIKRVKHCEQSHIGRKPNMSFAQ
ncbi:hypothetical protein yinte0001_31130 [Yersinia intermedia ATCC 29909]|nr:hypothetical protein yinte0001_31130 [Yersinia intermedia ATCC 29909]